MRSYSNRLTCVIHRLNPFGKELLTYGQMEMKYMHNWLFNCVNGAFIPFTLNDGHCVPSPTKQYRSLANMTINDNITLSAKYNIG